MLYEFDMDGYDVEAMGELVPELYREAVRNGTLSCVLTYDGDTEPDCLVGLCLLRVSYGWQEIVWVSLTEAYDLPEYAADIIWNREEAAREQGELLGTFADFPPEEERTACFYRLAGFDLRDYEEDEIKLVRATRAYEIKVTSRLETKFATLTTAQAEEKSLF